jgi:hypothetical protein
MLLPVTAVLVADDGTTTSFTTELDTAGAVDLQSLITAGQPIPPARYTLAQPLTVRQGQTVDLTGSVLDGAQPVTGWASDGSGHWSAAGKLPAAYAVQQGTISEVVAGPDGNLAGYKEQMWLDGAYLTRVGSLAGVKPGTFWQDYAANRCWIGDDPTSRLVEMSTAACAFNVTQPGVTLIGGTVQRFANAPQSGAVNIRATGCHVNGLVTQDNHAVGVYFANAGNSTRTGGGDYRNDQLGMSVYACAGAVIDSVEHAHNNPHGLYRILDWESGGLKASGNTKVVVKDGNSHDNRGLGYWQDVSNRSCTFLDCDSTGNSADGYRCEISFGAQVVGGSAVKNCLEQLTARGANNGSPYLCSEVNMHDASADKDGTPSLVSGVKVDATLNGVFCQARPRGNAADGTPWTLAARVTGCDITMPPNGVSGRGGLSGADFSKAVFDGNAYHVDGGTHWQNGNGNNLTLAGWQAAGLD